MMSLWNKWLCINSLFLFSGSVWAVDVLDARIKMAPPTATVTAGFMVLKNTSAKDVRLIKVSAHFSRATEMHAMEMTKSGMEMRPVDSILLKAHSETHLKPGGLHIMFIDLLAPLKKEESHVLTLFFDDKTEKKLNVRVESIGSRPSRP